MIFANDRALRDMVILIHKKHGVEGLIPYLESLEERISKIESRKPGRPRKQNATNEA